MEERFLKKYGATNWYDWRIRNWGTKWNMSEPNINIFINGDRAEMKIDLLSPWNGAYRWFKLVCSEYGFDGLYIDHEMGSYFFNKIVVEDGEVEEEIASSYFSEESVEYFGIEYFVTYFTGAFENIEDLKSRPEFLELFQKHGYDLHQVSEFALQ